MSKKEIKENCEIEMCFKKSFFVTVLIYVTDN